MKPRNNYLLHTTLNLFSAYGVGKGWMLVLPALMLLSFGDSAQAATFTWNGLGGNVNWNTSGNWTGGVPTDNVATDLIFAGTTNVGTIGTPLNQNISPPMLFNSITFDATAGNFFLGVGTGGGGFHITGGDTSTITQSSANNQSIANTITHIGSNNTTGALVLAGDGGGVVTLSGAITDGSGSRLISVTKSGTSTFTLSSVGNTYSGATSVSAGTLSISGSINSSATINVSGGVLSTTGTDKLANAAAVTVSGGTLTVGGADTVGTLAMSSGFIGGSNTLTASTYSLSGGTVTGNLGAGTMNVTGSTALDGTAGATAVNINSGTLTLGANDRLANGATVTVAGGILNTGAALTDTVNIFNMSSGSLGGTGTITAATYGLSGGTVNANLGLGTMNVTTGTVNLNGTSGSLAVNVNSGTLTLGAIDRLSDSATVTVAGGILNTGAALTDTVNIFNMSSGSLGGTGTITAATYGLSGGTVNANLGLGTVNVTGSTALNGTADATAVNLSAGTLTLGSNNRLSSGATATLTGGTLAMGTFTNSVNAVSLQSGNITGSGTGAITSATAFDVRSGSVSAILDGSLGLNKTTGGTVTLSGANSYTGATSITTGTLQVNGSIASGSTVGVATAGTLSGTGTVNGNATLTGAGIINFSSGGTIGGTLAITGGNWNGTGSVTGLVTSSSGTLTIGSGANLTATTGVSATGGAIVINGTLTGALNANATTTVSGTGLITGNVDILGTHNPGNSPGIQTFGADLDYTGGASVMNWELGANTITNNPNPGAFFDQIVVGGDLSFIDETTLNLLFSGGTVQWSNALWDTNQSWLLYDVAGTTTSFANLDLITTNWQDSFGNFFNTSRNGSSFLLSQSNEDVVLNYIVPEPNVAALLGALGMLVLLRRRR